MYRTQDDFKEIRISFRNCFYQLMREIKNENRVIKTYFLQQSTNKIR